MTSVLPPCPDLASLAPPVSTSSAGGISWTWVLPDAPSAEPWLAWLATRSRRPRWFVQPDPGTWDLGLGVARRLDLSSSPEVELPAGLLLWPCWTSTGNRVDPDWGELAQPSVWDPVFAIGCRDGAGRITWNSPEAPADPAEATRELGRWLLAGAVTDPGTNAPLAIRSVTESPRSAWDAGVAHILAGCREHRIDKAVLGCWREWQLAAAPDPLDLLRRLPAGPSTRLLVEDGAGTAFLALSPEFLYRRRGKSLVCDALAGTRTRGHTNGEQRFHSQELLASGKDHREQALVVSGLQRDLDHAGATRILAGPVTVHEAGSLLHLHSIVTAEGPPGGDLALIRALHPTPALGGEPREAARELLQGLEGFRRGLYGGLVGILGPDRADVSVGIRCARLRGTRLRFHAGAGIVPGSIAEDEWQETRLKLAVLEGALGLAPQGGPPRERTPQ